MPIIRISGYPGAGKTTIAKRLAADLGYDYFYTGGLFREMARARGQSIEDFYRALKDDPGAEAEIDNRIAKLMEEKDNLVVEGRMAPFQKSPYKTINILIKVSPSEGARRQAERPENAGKAVAEIEKLTAERIRNEREHYYRLHGIKNHLAESAFSIVVDTTELATAAAVKLVIKAVRRKLNKMSQ
jgi:CMP/dCMP kinase